MPRGVSGGPGSLTYDFAAGVDSFWIAHNEYGDSIYVWDNIHLNYTEHCPPVGGRRYRDYFMDFVQARLSIPSSGTGSSDGVYLDELSQGGYFWWDPISPALRLRPGQRARSADSVQAWPDRSIDLFAIPRRGPAARGLIMGANCKPFQ